MSIIIRLQNLPWAADSLDIRRYFSGLSIPEGGVHIVGGEMGDAFIAFSTDEDARLAMAKDAGKIHEMQIKLLLSSRTEMMRVIEKARQLNLALQSQALPIPPSIVPVQPQPARITPPSVEGDRRRGRSPSPSRRRSRDKSPARDRRRSPDSRRSSKRERSRSPTRPSRSSSNRDTDRRDRFKRDDRRYDEASRYRDDRHSGRETSQESKKYPDTDHLNRQSRPPPTEEFLETSNNGYNDAPANASVASSYTYEAPRTSESLKDLPAAFYAPPPNPMLSSDPFAIGKQTAPIQISSSSINVYSQQQPISYGSLPYEAPVPVSKEPLPVSLSAQANQRQTRFEAEFTPPQETPFFTTSVLAAKPTVAKSAREATYNDTRSIPQDFHPPTRDKWPPQSDVSSTNWADKRHGLLDPPSSKNSDFIQVVPMDIEQSPPQMPSEKNTFNRPDQYFTQRSLPPFKNEAPPRNEDILREMPKRGTDMRLDKQWHESPPATAEIRGLPPDVRISEIQEMFRSPIPPSNISIQTNAQGAEKAFIRFATAADFEEAINKQPRYIRNYRCEISPCPTAAFEAAASAPNSMKPRPKPKPREEDLCVQLRGLPYSCKEKEIEHFFGGLRIIDIALETSPEGRSVGVAFVQFATPKDFRMALTMNGKMIAHRYITISVASKEYFALIRGSEYPKLQRPKSPPRGPMNNNFGSPRGNKGADGPLMDQRPASGPLPPNHTRSMNFCLSLRDMPMTVTNQDIVDFLSDLGITIRAIHLMLDVDKTPTGDAFVEVSTQREADMALSKNGRPLLGNRITVMPISFREMMGILGGPSLPPPPVPGPLLKTPPIASAEKSRRPLIPQAPIEEHLNELPSNDHPQNERLHFDHPENKHPHFVDEPYFDHPRNEQPHPEFPAGERPRPNFPPEDRRLNFQSGERPDFPPGERPRPNFPPGERPRPDFPPGERPRPDFPRGERFRPNFPRGERPRFDYPRGERPRFEPRMRGGRPRMERGMRPPFERARGPFPNRPHGPPSQERNPAAGFGAPGCVVSINNLHFKAGLEELLHFFNDFILTKDSIIRKFDEIGRATAEARVAFQNPREAQRAISELDRKTIMGRPLSLSLL